MTNFNDKITICTLLVKLCYPFTTMDDFHLSKHVLMSLLCYLPTVVPLNKEVIISFVLIKFSAVLTVIKSYNDLLIYLKRHHDCHKGFVELYMYRIYLFMFISGCGFRKQSTKCEAYNELYMRTTGPENSLPSVRCKMIYTWELCMALLNVNIAVAI